MVFKLFTKLNLVWHKRGAPNKDQIHYISELYNEKILVITT